MADKAMIELLSRRKDRALAIILRFKELDCDDHLPQHVRSALRKIILDQFNSYHELAADLLESTSDGALINELWLAKLDEIHSVVVANGQS
jgi:hypothetical protein